MKKKKYYLLLLLTLIISCSSAIFNKEKEPTKEIIISYIEFRNQQKTIDPKTNILIIGAQTAGNKKDNYWIDVCFVNPALLMDFKYSKVYEVNGYKLIISEDLDKSYLLEKSFKEVPYENFNKAKIAITYNTTNWHIILNSRNEVIEILPQEKASTIKSILEKKGVKFSKDYVNYSSY